MSTHCHVILHDSPDDQGMILYKHRDGYPDAMLPNLEILLDHAQDIMKEANYSRLYSDKVAAILIAESVDDRCIPEFTPCRSLDELIDYTYHVHLSDEGWELTVEDHGDDED